MRMRDINPTDLATKTGVPQPTIFRILTGESNDPRTTTLRPIAAYFGVTVEQLREGDLSAETNLSDPGLCSPTPRNIDAHRLQVGGVSALDGQVLLHDDLVSLEFIDYPLTHASTYAIQVRGNALRPRARPGEFLIVDPVKKISPGDDVILQLINGTRLIRTLLYLREDEITVATLTSNTTPESLPLSDVLDTQRIIGIINLND